MNEAHLKLCSSDEWSDGLKQWIIPGALEDRLFAEVYVNINPYVIEFQARC